jgi:hypothetical protein
MSKLFDDTFKDIFNENENEDFRLSERIISGHIEFFFKQKNCSKLYNATYWVPDTTYDTLIGQDDLDEYKDQIDEQRREFLEEHPDKANDANAWAEWMDDYDWGVDEDNVQYDGDSAVPQLTHVDFRHPVKAYAFQVDYFVHRKDMSGSKKIMVPLTDEEYINILTDYVLNRISTVEDIKTDYPEAYKKIGKEASAHGNDYEISFLEVKEDAEACMNQKSGEKE